MSISSIEIGVPNAESVTVTKDTLSVDLSDGRTISVPLSWFPRLVHATLAERSNWRLIGKGHGVHWPDIDEDISIEGLLAGRDSGDEVWNAIVKSSTYGSSDGAAENIQIPLAIIQRQRFHNYSPRSSQVGS